MTEDAQNNLTRRVRAQTVEIARGFFGASLARLKERLRDDRSQLEYLAEQLREERTRSRIRELVDSYSAIEGSIEEAARDLGLEDVVDKSAGQPQESEGQDGQRSREAVGQSVKGTQDAVAGTVSRATEAASQVAGRIGHVAENLPGSHLLGRTTDEAGRTLQRVVDETGNIIQTTLDEKGELVSRTCRRRKSAPPSKATPFAPSGTSRAPLSSCGSERTEASSTWRSQRAMSRSPETRAGSGQRYRAVAITLLGDTLGAATMLSPQARSEDVTEHPATHIQGKVAYDVQSGRRARKPGRLEPS